MESSLAPAGKGTAGRTLLNRHRAPGIAALRAEEVATLVAPLAAAHARDASDEKLIAVAKCVIAALSDTAPQSAAADPRVSAAIRYVRDHIDGPIFSLSEGGHQPALI
jgi:hypothetical protein